MNLKSLVMPAGLMVANMVLPLLDKMAKGSPSPLDDFAVKSMRTFLRLFEDDNTITDEEALDAALNLFGNDLIPILEVESAKSETKYDDAAVKSLKDAFLNFKKASGLDQ